MAQRIVLVFPSYDGFRVMLRPSAREQSLLGFRQDETPGTGFSMREAPLQKELYTLAECAAILSVSERTVETLVAQGHLRSAVAPGTDRARRVSRAMLEDYIRAFNGERSSTSGKRAKA